MKTIYTSIFTYIYALLFSLLEIEIEGKNGWGKKIPTFTIKKGIFKNFTFYHLIMNLIVITTNTFHIFLYQGFSKRTLMYAIYNVILWFFTEDFLWFVLNPYFTLKKYNKESISWHSNQPWIFGMPFHNYICLFILGLVTYLLNDKYLIRSNIIMFVLTLIIIKLSPIYHSFYLKQKRHEI